MKKGYIAIALLPIILGAFWGYSKSHQKTLKKDEVLISQIIADILENGHYSPTRLNDEFSEAAFNKYLEFLDFNKQLLLQSDIDKLGKYRTKIDDELKDAELEFYFKAVDRLYKRLDEVEEFYEELFQEPFEFDGKESFETDSEKRDFFKTDDERLEYWKGYAKYLTMNRLANKISKQDNDKAAAEKKGEEFEEKSFEILEKNARRQAKESIGTRFKRRREIDDEDQFAYFINSVSAAFGPHSQYFPPQEKENFEMRMTGRLEGIGAQLSQENEHIKVVSIVPGSASWRQGDLKENDLIIKVAQGEEEPVDIVAATMKDAISLIRGPKGTEVRLTVQKPNGDVTEISIIRDIVVQEETYAKSALISNEKTKQEIGYIYLPTFYSTFGSKEGRRSAQDIRFEVNRLKDESVSGIIIDLRNNGGGSLQDAVDMAGHFFEKGPVVQVKDEGRAPRVYSDRNPNVAYNGPLIVMVNNFSASASEILAAALKDYDRAVIVGTTTFGKGTVQTMLDLNRYLSEGDNPSRQLGSYKLTIQQFYRINGASTQLKGVRPDIMLPNPYGYMETGIKAYDNALPWDSIKPADYSSWTGGSFDLGQLNKQSKDRVKESAVFQEVLSRNVKYRAERDNSVVELNLDKEVAERAENKVSNKAFEDLFEKDESIEFMSLQVFKPEEEEDVKKEKKDRWEKQLSKDYELAETIHIMQDMIK